MHCQAKEKNLHHEGQEEFYFNFVSFVLCGEGLLLRKN